MSRALYKSTVLIYNEAGEVVRTLYTYVDDPGKQTVSQVTLSANVIAPSGMTTAGTPTSLDDRFEQRDDGGVGRQGGQRWIRDGRAIFRGSALRRTARAGTRCWCRG